MKQFYRLIIFSLIAFNFSFSQSGNTSPLQGRLLLSFNGAVAIAKTDYTNTVPSPMGTGTVEYYFDINSMSSIGIRVYGGLGRLEGTDDNRIPDKYSDDIYFFGGGLTYGLAINNKFVPYLFLGLTNLWYNPKDNEDNVIVTSKPPSVNLTSMAYNYEAGIKIFLSGNSTLNVGGGEFISKADNLDGINTGNHNDVIFYGSVGISIAFLGNSDSDNDGVWDSQDACPDTPPGIEVDLLGCPLDTDKDGVPDYLDKCNDTPAGVPVDNSGCPIDSDDDGVADYLDNCPHTPPGIPVDSHGCIKDSDEDNVPDYLDNCPDTPEGIKVDSTGCPEDLNQNGIPDYLEKKEIIPEQKTEPPEVEKSNYDLQNDHLVKNMIFTDGKLYTAQISSWKTKWKAESLAEELRKNGYNAFVTEFFVEKLNQVWFQVRVGYFDTFREAQKVAESLR